MPCLYMAPLSDYFPSFLLLVPPLPTQVRIFYLKESARFPIFKRRAAKTIVLTEQFHKHYCEHLIFYLLIITIITIIITIKKFSDLIGYQLSWFLPYQDSLIGQYASCLSNLLKLWLIGNWTSCRPIHFLILGKIGQENVFHYILNRKYAFLNHKIKKLKKKSKNCDFPKVGSAWFSTKIGQLSIFF